MTDNTKPTTDKLIGSEPFEFFSFEIKQQPYVNPRKLLMDDDIHDEIEESKPLEESTEKQVKHRIEEVEYESAPETIDIRKQNKMLLSKKTEITKDIIFLDFDGIKRINSPSRSSCTMVSFRTSHWTSRSLGKMV